MDILFRGILKLSTVEECYDFFEDLCTISELRAMVQRFQVARMLDEGRIYSDIVQETGASTATISRVNKCLVYGSDGYRRMLDRLKEEGLLQELHEKICIGQGYRGKSGALGVGSCTSGFKYNLKGCPPTDEQMYEFLKQYIATRRKTEAEKVFNATFDMFKEELAKGEKVSVAGFGTFKISERAAREGRNPLTGEKLQIAASKSVSFKAGTELKKVVNK